ncbi:MAG TPA: endonuclease/exonuclease/phosphatase family protein [Chitinispirillaceae bacterium]|nr:endonuclease/exonuclease/phosphatase family protein [Chitinispirillaceae bacterium]
MSYNVRYGAAHDRKNRWENRRPMVVNLLNKRGPDIIGTQEALRFQLDDIKDDLKHYSQLGSARDDGFEKGEYSAILYKTKRFEIIESETFWFSDTPSVPGSSHWGNKLPRICTWALFKERSTRKGLYLFNLHLDHKSAFSRQKSINLLVNKIVHRKTALPVIITGDFNVIERDSIIKYLKGETKLSCVDQNSSVRMIDVFRKLNPYSFDGTLNLFLGLRYGPRIDYIFTDASTHLIASEIDRSAFNGRYPSDHFPVIARVRY